MWQDVGELAVDLFLPAPGPDLDRDSIFDKKDPNMLRVPLAQPGAFKRRLNQSGWFDEEVVAAGLLTQGKAQSLLSMVTGWALVELVRARRSSRSRGVLPRRHRDNRVIALEMSPWSEGSGAEGSTDAVVKVKRDQAGSWSRGCLRIDLDARNLKSGEKGGTLDLAGSSRFP